MCIYGKDTDVQTSQEFVRRARSTLELSKTEFGQMLGISRQTIWRYETMDPLPKKMRRAITELLNKHRKQRKRNEPR